MPFGGMLVSGGASIISSLIGAHAQSQAAKNAATAQVNAANDVLGFAVPRTQESQAAVTAGVKGANDRLEQGLGESRDVLSPYTRGGANGVNNLSAMDPFSYNPLQLTDDPDYQFRLQQGQKGLEASAAARGGVMSGSTLKALNTFNSGMASQEYQNAFNRALTSYNTNESRYRDLAGIGLSAAGTETSANLATAGTEAGNTMTGASENANLNTNLTNTYANARTGAGNAQSASAIAQGNATAGLFNNIGNTATSLFNNYQQQQQFNRWANLYQQQPQVRPGDDAQFS